MAGELRALYRESMRLEAAFFGEQPGLPRPPTIGVLVVDFDETCTAADTTGLIIGAAIAEAERTAGGAPLQHLTRAFLVWTQYTASQKRHQTPAIVSSPYCIAWVSK